MSDSTQGKKSNPARLRIWRRDGPREAPRWESFEVPSTHRQTIADALELAQLEARTADGKPTPPVAFEAPCGTGTCGGCTILVNGQAQLACRHFVAQASPKGKPIKLQPLPKHPVVRDLVVDLSGLETELRRLEPWLQTSSRQAGPLVVGRPQQQRLLELDACIECGACLDACPQYGSQTDFVGPAALVQLERLDHHPTGKLERPTRLDRAMAPGGIAECGNAQVCVEVCPTRVPLVSSLQRLARGTTRRWLGGN